MEIFKLVGSVMVDTAEAEESIQKTSEKTEGLGKKLSEGIGKAANWAKGLVSGAVEVGKAMVDAARDTAAQLDVVDKASQRMKISATSYQELAHAAGLCGVSMSTMEKAAKKLEGTDLNLDQALDQIYSLGTAEERAAKAAELFGEKTAYELTPMLNASAEDMAAMRQEAEDLGLVMGEEAVANGAAMNDMFSKIDESIAGLKNGLMTELMPYIMEIMDWIIENIPMIRETIKNVLDAVMPIVRPVVDAIMAVLPPIMDAVKKVLDWLAPYIEKIINGVMEFFNAFKALFNGDLEGFLDGIVGFIVNIGGALWDAGKSIFQSLWDGIKSVWESIKSWVSDKVDWLVDKVAFWRKGSDEISDGESHAGGLPFVPYDNYPALLHRGETVMTASDTQSLLGDIRNALAGGGSGPINITVQSVLDGRVIGESVTTYQRQRARAYGV